MSEIGNLQRVPLRDVWGRERDSFTPWLADHIDVLSDTIGLSISIVDREHRPTERLSVDLLGETETGEPVVIENQLEESNHDHLGKLITYLAVTDAKVGIWIVADHKPEHVRAVSWLNQTYAADFYLVKLEAVRVDESLPAPLLTLIDGPSEVNLIVEPSEVRERDRLRQEFWAQLLDRARERTPLFATISPGTVSSLYTTVKRGLFLRFAIRQHDTEAGLYIDRGNEDENYEIFNALINVKERIEEEFGEPLEWRPLDNRRACRIVKPLSLGGYRSEAEDWEEIQDAMIDAMIRLNNALGPHIEAF